MRGYLYEHLRTARKYALAGDYFIMECVLESAYLEAEKRGEDARDEIEFFKKIVYDFMDLKSKGNGLEKRLGLYNSAK